jgi:hypothetical protein
MPPIYIHQCAILGSTSLQHQDVARLQLSLVTVGFSCFFFVFVVPSSTRAWLAYGNNLGTYTFNGSNETDTLIAIDDSGVAGAAFWIIFRPQPFWFLQTTTLRNCFDINFDTFNCPRWVDYRIWAQENDKFSQLAILSLTRAACLFSPLISDSNKSHRRVRQWTIFITFPRNIVLGSLNNLPLRYGNLGADVKLQRTWQFFISLSEPRLWIGARLGPNTNSWPVLICNQVQPQEEVASLVFSRINDSYFGCWKIIDDGLN